MQRAGGRARKIAGGEEADGDEIMQAAELDSRECLPPQHGRAAEAPWDVHCFGVQPQVDKLSGPPQSYLGGVNDDNAGGALGW